MKPEEIRFKSHETFSLSVLSNVSLFIYIHLFYSLKGIHKPINHTLPFLFSKSNIKENLVFNVFLTRQNFFMVFDIYLQAVNYRRLQTPWRRVGSSSTLSIQKPYVILIYCLFVNSFGENCQRSKTIGNNLLFHNTLYINDIKL